MVASTNHPKIHIAEFNGQMREVRLTRTARIYSRPKLIAELDRLLMDPPEHDSPDDLRDLAQDLKREEANFARSRWSWWIPKPATR